MHLTIHLLIAICSLSQIICCFPRIKHSVPAVSKPASDAYSADIQQTESTAISVFSSSTYLPSCTSPTASGKTSASSDAKGAGWHFSRFESLIPFLSPSKTASSQNPLVPELLSVQRASAPAIKPSSNQNSSDQISSVPEVKPAIDVQPPQGVDIPDSADSLELQPPQSSTHRRASRHQKRRGGGGDPPDYSDPPPYRNEAGANSRNTNNGQPSQQQAPQGRNGNPAYGNSAGAGTGGPNTNRVPGGGSSANGPANGGSPGGSSQRGSSQRGPPQTPQGGSSQRGSTQGGSTQGGSTQRGSTQGGSTQRGSTGGTSKGKKGGGFFGKVASLGRKAASLGKTVWNYRTRAGQTIGDHVIGYGVNRVLDKATGHNEQNDKQAGSSRQQTYPETSRGYDRQPPPNNMNSRQPNRGTSYNAARYNDGTSPGLAQIIKNWFKSYGVKGSKLLSDFIHNHYDKIDPRIRQAFEAEAGRALSGSSSSSSPRGSRGVPSRSNVENLVDSAIQWLFNNYVEMTGEVTDKALQYVNQVMKNSAKTIKKWFSGGGQEAGVQPKATYGYGNNERQKATESPKVQASAYVSPPLSVIPAQGIKSSSPTGPESPETQATASRSPPLSVIPAQGIRTSSPTGLQYPETQATASKSPPPSETPAQGINTSSSGTATLKPVETETAKNEQPKNLQPLHPISATTTIVPLTSQPPMSPLKTMVTTTKSPLTTESSTVPLKDTVKITHYSSKKESATSPPISTLIKMSQSVKTGKSSLVLITTKSNRTTTRSTTKSLITTMPTGSTSNDFNSIPADSPLSSNSPANASTTMATMTQSTTKSLIATTPTESTLPPRDQATETTYSALAGPPSPSTGSESVGNDTSTVLNSTTTSGLEGASTLPAASVTSQPKSPSPNYQDSVPTSRADDSSKAQKIDDPKTASQDKTDSPHKPPAEQINVDTDGDPTDKPKDESKVDAEREAKYNYYGTVKGPEDDDNHKDDGNDHEDDNNDQET